MEVKAVAATVGLGLGLAVGVGIGLALAPVAAAPPEGQGKAAESDNSAGLAKPPQSEPRSAHTAAGPDVCADPFAEHCPFCVAVLGGSEEALVVKMNATFEREMGPRFKFANEPFIKGFTATPEGANELREAVRAVQTGAAVRQRVRNVEMLSLAEGLPIKKHFDWVVGKEGTGPEARVMVWGLPCTERDVEKAAQDAELIDLFQNAPIALHWLSGEGNVLWANQTELNVLGYTAEEYIGQPIMNFCPDEKELVLEIFQQLGSGNTIRDVPVRFRTKDGRIVNLLIDSNVRYNPDGSFGHTRCFIRDDTARKVREARQEMAAQEMQRSKKLLDNFLSRCLHHIHTPCHVIHSLLHDLQEGLTADTSATATASAPTPQTMQLVRQSQTLMADMVAMINDVSDVMRFDQGLTPKLEVAPANLVTLCQDVVQLTQENQVLRKGVACYFQWEDEKSAAAPVEVMVDGKKLSRVLIHLMRNAAAATTKGRVALTFTREAGGRYRFRVKDTGRGLGTGGSGANKQRVFQRYQEDLDQSLALSAHTLRSEGVGIGLSLSYDLVRSLGGELLYTSEPGETEFYFTLPLSAAPAAAGAKNNQPSPVAVAWDSVGSGEGLEAVQWRSEVETETKPEATMSAPPPILKLNAGPADIAAKGLKAMDKPHVLVVEDNLMCQKVLLRHLAKHQCTCDVAENGQEALDKLQAAIDGIGVGAAQYSLVLMDLRMPVMDGIEATRRIRTDLRLSVPVVAITAETGEGIMTECEGVGFDAFQAKPLHPKQLVQILTKHGLVPAPAKA
eukprot:CAMPEP_0170135428 /NCGR_PEP_ID=MMETSP0033_2-20121228/2473_1 /TAXON_ID=195969 /ORGANISM="Dolichomastix tenuilepis, Strain CCMP3274" /LENGTH=788 /DNA_ID=CAMNT_0010371027 /DNA_START=31 /DNA_END=2397 /DNA_ORIENTATION=-